MCLTDYISNCFVVFCEVLLYIIVCTCVWSFWPKRTVLSVFIITKYKKLFDVFQTTNTHFSQTDYIFNNNFFKLIKKNQLREISDIQCGNNRRLEVCTTIN